jgi:hypothetical protein
VAKRCFRVPGYLRGISIGTCANFSEPDSGTVKSRTTHRPQPGGSAFKCSRSFFAADRSGLN